MIKGSVPRVPPFSLLVWWLLLRDGTLAIFGWIPSHWGFAFDWYVFRGPSMTRNLSVGVTGCLGHLPSISSSKRGGFLVSFGIPRHWTKKCLMTYRGYNPIDPKLPAGHPIPTAPAFVVCLQSPCFSAKISDEVPETWGVHPNLAAGDLFGMVKTWPFEWLLVTSK